VYGWVVPVEGVWVGGAGGGCMGGAGRGWVFLKTRSRSGSSVSNPPCGVTTLLLVFLIELDFLYGV